MIWSLDSNVFIDGLRIADAEADMAEFLRSGPDVEVSSIVAAELEKGARTPRARARLESGVIGALLRRGRVVAPNDSEWQRMGRLLGDHPEWPRTASRQNDVLLAVQCVERGWALVTRDKDFAGIARALPALRSVLPFPRRPPD